MVDYVEDPIGRIVNVHWKDPDDPDPPPDPTTKILRCGTFEYTVDYGNPITISSSLGNPFEVRDPTDLNFGIAWLPGLTLTPQGIVFGYYGVHETCFVYMTAASYDLEVSGDGGSGLRLPLGLVFMNGPRDYNLFRNSLGVPIGPAFMAIGPGSWSWHYNISPGNKGSYSPVGIDWEDPTRWDPEYGGHAWLVSDLYGSRYFVGGFMGPGDGFSVRITSHCPIPTDPDIPVEYASPIAVTDDGVVHAL